MSIQSEIDRIQKNVQDTISTIQQTGVSVPEGANSDDLPSLSAALANEKQDKLTGQQGQVVGFDSQGNAVAQDAPESGISQENADARYLKLTGGTVTGFTTINSVIIPGENPEIAAVVGPNSKPFAVGVVDENSPNFATAAGFLFTSNGITATKQISLGGNKLEGIRPNPTDSDEAASKAYVDSQKPKYVAVNLTAAGWSNNQQTVTINGVSATETAQLIQPMPAVASQQAYMAAGIYCSGQAANSLTFTCSSVPTQDIAVYVVIQEVSL